MYDTRAIGRASMVADRPDFSKSGGYRTNTMIEADFFWLSR